MARQFLVPVALPADAGSPLHAVPKQQLDAAIATRVATTRSVLSGTGLTGGGDLSADRTLAVSYGSSAGTAVQGNDARVVADQVAGTASIRTLGTGAQQAAAGNDSRITGAVQGARQVIAGTGLTGGGDLTADRTLGVSYGSGAGTAVQGNDTRVVADQAAVTASIRTLGTGALQAAAGNHTHSYVPTTRTITAGTGLTGGGDLSADRTLAVSYGTTAGTAAQGNDSRIGDASSLTTGTVGTARLPNLLSAVRTVAPSAGTISINADTSGNNVDSTLTGDTTLNVPTNGASGQAIQGTVLASGAQRVLTFHASFGRLSPLVNTLTIPSGKVGRYSIRRTDITGAAKWLVEAAGVEQ